jgi:hypothetical protein
MGKIPAVTALNADVTEPAMVYARLYQEFIDGRHDADFLKKLAMMATQVDDKEGSIEAGSAYAATLTLPLSDDDIRFVSEHTVSSKDKGFALMMQDSTDFYLPDIKILFFIILCMRINRQNIKILPLVGPPNGNGEKYAGKQAQDDRQRKKINKINNAEQ